jgi:PKD repeat protein
MPTRVSSLDNGYIAGDLSIYPQALDDKDTLYEAKNNAETNLKQSMTYNAKNIVVEDASAFPSNGLLRIGPKSGVPGMAELIYYGKKNNNIFGDLLRGFAGSRQNSWPAGAYVANSVMAEHHNALKDAILNIERNVGMRMFPDAESLNGLLKTLENRFLAPKPIFRGYPLKGPPGLKVRFQNFSGGDVIRYLWDFGDGTTSIDKNPTHTFSQNGFYTIKLNVITSTGAQGIAIKNNYVKVSEDESIPFFYIEKISGDVDDEGRGLSIETAADQSMEPAVYRFVDQTDGDIFQRYWVFDDGSNLSVTDPNHHTATYSYQKPNKKGYEPSLLIVFANQQLKRVFLNTPPIKVG